MKKKCLLVFLAMALVLQLVLLVAAYPAPSHGAQNAVNKFEAAQDAMSFAHRAAWRNSPENSLIAIYDCIMMGIDAAEIDLMMTSDGVLVLVHDSTINRTVSGYTGNVSDYTWAKLKTMPLRNGKGGSSAAVYKMDASDAKILNSLPNYATHVGTAASGQSLSTARFDDALDLLAMYGPDTYFTLDKTNNEKVFIASYKLLREKGMLDRAFYKFSTTAATLNTWATNAATTWNAAYPNDTITKTDVLNSILYMYVTGSTATSNLQQHLDNGTYLKAVELTYGADTKDAKESAIVSTYAPFCKKNGIALYCSTLGTGYCGGRLDNETTWAELLDLGFDGIQTDRASELAAFLNAYNRERGANETIQAEHFHHFNSASYKFSITETADSSMNKPVANMQNGDYLAFENIAFDGQEYQLSIYARGLLSGAKLNFYVDSIASGNLIASKSLSVTSALQTVTVNLSKVPTAGTRTLYVQASGTAGSALLNLDHFRFVRDAKYLYFDFLNSASDKLRYQSKPYGGVNYDVQTNWWAPEGRTTAPAITNGVISTTVASGDTTNYHYIETGTAWEAHPLSFAVKSEPYYCYVRLKIDNAVSSETSGKSEFILFYGVDGAKIDAASVRTSFTMADVSDKGYVEFKLAMPSTLSGNITSLRPFINKVQSAEGKQASFTYDYIYLGPDTYGPEQDQLFIDFNNTEADRARYASKTYSGVNLDLASNWYHMSSRTSAPSIADGALSFSILPSDSTKYQYVQTGKQTALEKLPLYFTPSDKDVCQVRIKIENAVSSSSDGKTASFHLFYATDTIVAGENRNDSIEFDLTKYNNNGYFILTFPMDSADYLAANKITALRPFFNNAVSDGEKQARFSIDYIYVGPEADLPAKDELFFDFTNNAAAKERYNRRGYGYLNFDNASNWERWTASQVDSISVSGGALKISCPAEPNWTKSPIASGLTLNDQPLLYVPTANDYCTVRLRIDGAVSNNTNGSSLFRFYYWPDGGAYQSVTQSFVMAERTDKGYFTLSFPITGDAWKNANAITKIMFTVEGFKAAEGKELSYSVDYLHIGKKADRPIAQDGCLFYDYDNSSAAKARYNSKTYGNLNYDLKGSWNGSTGVTGITVSNGALQAQFPQTVKSSGEEIVWWALYNGTTYNSRYTALQYTPGDNDYCVARFKIDNAVSSRSSGTIDFVLYGYLNGTSTSVSHSVRLNAADVVGKGYITCKFPLNQQTYLDAVEISGITPSFNAVKSAEGKTAAVSIDYIWVGEESKAPVADNLLFDFTNNTAAKQRYALKTYNGVNYDLASNWLHNGGANATVSGGSLNGIVAYVRTAVGGTTAKTACTLQYTPKADDFLQVRFQITAPTKTIAKVKLYYLPSDQSAWASVASTAFVIQDATYAVATIPLAGTGFAQTNEVSGIQIAFEGTEGEGLKVDYIYIGPKASMPRSTYTVTYKNYNGAVLQEKYITSGQPDTYSLTTPTKPSDAKYHYTFKGWDKATTSITANTTVTAQYTSAAHRYTYSETDKKFVCGDCGYKSATCNHTNKYTWDTDGDNTLEILAIGNSFSDDALAYAWQIARDLGIEKVVIGNLYIGGCSLATHASNATNDAAKYTYRLNEDGSFVSTANSKISTALTSRSWDYVSMQQNSGNSGLESTYNADLTNLIAYVQNTTTALDNANRNCCTRLVWHSTWAYQQDSTHADFAKYNNNQTTMYNGIITATKNKIATNSAFYAIVPNGTTIQNARTSLMGDTLTRDGYHLSIPVGRYMAGLAFISKVTGLSIDNIQYKPDGVTDLQQDIAIESAKNAIKTPYSVTKSAMTVANLTDGYFLLHPQMTKLGFWHSGDAANYNKVITAASNSMNFCATVRFTKESLPVGSIIVLKSGWQYRPEGWITDAVQSAREANTTAPVELVTEEWWKNYTIRAFNISMVGTPSLESVTEAEIRDAFQIYVPSGTHKHSYDNGVVTKAPTLTTTGTKLCTCLYCTATKTESVPVSSNSLFFDFDNDANAQSRYNNYTYSFKNFDLAESWMGRTTGWSNGTQAIANGAITVTPGTDGDFTSIYADSAQTGLHFDPEKAEVFQIRFKMKGFSGTQGKATIQFYPDAATNGGYSSNTVATFGASYLNNGEYIIVTKDIDQKIRDMASVERIVIHFSGFTNPVSDAAYTAGTLTIDYAYIGPEAGLPMKDALYFDFTNTAQDQARYQSKMYGYYNFDDAANWAGRTHGFTPGTAQIANGALTIGATTADETSIYADTKLVHNSADHSVCYDPDHAEAFQIRFKMQNLVGTKPYASIRFYNGTTESAKSSLVSFDASVLTSNQYIILTGDIAETVRACDSFDRIIVHFGGLTTTTESKVTLDYVYVGAKSGLPTPQYTVTFVGADGKTLATQIVHKGETASYTGATPTKAYDSTNHYTFKGWDKALTNITADTTIKATFTATAHSYSYTKVDATNHKATCTCGYSKSVAHTWNSGSVTTQPSCTATGVKTFTCSACKQTKTEAVAKLGHSYTTKVTAPTCTEQGYTTHTCSRCSDSYKDTYVAATGHSWNSGTITTQPTCTTAGVKTFTCSACKTTRTESVAAKGHTEVIDKAVAATCTTAGKTEGKHCSVCNAVIKAQTTVAALGHKWDSGKVTTNATCTTDGLKTYTCQNDNSHTKTEPIAKLGHSYTIKVTAPTCNAQGYTTHTCSRCSDSYKDTYVAATGHSWNSGTITTQPSCTTVGVKTITCSTCKQTKTEAVAAKGHTEVIDVPVAPTCTTMGLTGGKHCSVCHKVLVAQETVDALGHAPVYADNGNKTHTITCKNCNYTETVACEYEDGKCICGAKEFVEPIYDDAVKFSHSLTLENDISINFIGLGSALIGYDSFYLECKVPVYNGNELVGYKTVNIEPVYNGKNYECTLLGVTAKMMNDEIEAVFRMTKDGQEYYSKTDVYSVAEYAYGKLDSTKTGDTAELKTVCANLLRYGSMAQIQFAYRTDALVDADMTATHKSYLTDLSKVEMKSYMNQLNDLPNFTVLWKSATLELGNKVIMCLIANLSSYNGDPSELIMRLTYTDSKGQNITVERPLELYDKAKMLYAVSYDGLRATEMRTIVSAAIYLNGTRVSKTVEYSIESYGGRNPSDLCRAMLVYGDSANIFFAN